MENPPPLGIHSIIVTASRASEHHLDTQILKNDPSGYPNISNFKIFNLKHLIEICYLTIVPIILNKDVMYVYAFIAVNLIFLHLYFSSRDG